MLQLLVSKQKECSVCLDAKATIYFPKCGHIVCCKECLDKLPKINRSNSNGILRNRNRLIHYNESIQSYISRLFSRLN